MKSESDIEIKILFSRDMEAQRVAKTLKRLPWYRENGYTESRIRLPQQLSEQSSDEEIRNVIFAKFAENAGAYEEFASYLQGEWPKVSVDLEKLREIPGFRLLDNYKIILTRYGTGGSYDSREGEVIASITFPTKERCLGTIIHEIIHLGIQHVIDKYNVKHWRKERLVDLIGNRYFSEGERKMQDIRDESAEVDDVFKKYFPDIDSIAKAIGEKQ